MVSNNAEFEANLKKLGDLYEEAKDIANKLIMVGGLMPPFFSDGQRMHQILQEMRDLAATQMQHKHFLNNN